MCHFIVALHGNRPQVIGLRHVISSPLEASDRLHAGLGHHHSREDGKQHAKGHDDQQRGAHRGHNLLGGTKVLGQDYRGATFLGLGQHALTTQGADGAFHGVPVRFKVPTHRQSITIGKGGCWRRDRDPSRRVVELKRSDLLIDILHEARILCLLHQHVRLLHDLLVDARRHRRRNQPVGHQRHHCHRDGDNDTSNQRKAPPKRRPRSPAATT